jgi:predicted secreted protein
MFRSIGLLVIFLTSALGASTHQVIDTLGVSPKGQYVALEEYGYKRENHSYYVIIKVMNVWSKEYVGTPIRVESTAIRPTQLKEARERARALAQQTLSKFKISQQG